MKLEHIFDFSYLGGLILFPALLIVISICLAAIQRDGKNRLFFPLFYLFFIVSSAFLFFLGFFTAAAAVIIAPVLTAALFFVKRNGH